MSDNTRCGFCNLDVFSPDMDLVEHPCCVMARERGDRTCLGCEAFRSRWQRGETCPHVSGKKRACCKPPKEK